MLPLCLPTVPGHGIVEEAAIIDTLHPDQRTVRQLSHPHTHLLRVLVDSRHQWELVSLFYLVALVDADGIHPNCSHPPGNPKPAEHCRRVLHHREGLSVEPDTRLVLLLTPCVAQRLVNRPVVEIDVAYSAGYRLVELGCWVDVENTDVGG